MKKNRFLKFFKIYLIVLFVAVVVIDTVLWVKLSRYEKNEQAKDEAKAASKQLSANTPVPSASDTPTATPTPEAVYENLTLILPEGVTVTVGGTEIELSDFDPEEYDDGTFNLIREFSTKYSEYENLVEDAHLPVKYAYHMSVLEGSEIVITDPDGNVLTPEETEDGNGGIILNAPYLSDPTDEEEITEYAVQAMEDYAWFATNDLKASDLAKYFPSNSEYLEAIGSVDNSWYVKHTKFPEVSNLAVSDYTRYSDTLVYVDISFTHTVHVNWNGETKYVDIDNPVWLIKMGDSWKIAAIEF